MKNKCLHLIAIFLIALIVSLPIYSSVAFAGLSNPSLKGLDNVEGYVQEEDLVTISVDAKIEGDSEISTSQVQFSVPGGAEFDDCTETETSQVHRCTYTFESSSVPNNHLKFSVYLFNDDRSEADRTEIEGDKDLISPKIIIFTSNPKITGSIINFNYKIEDYIYNGSSGKCAGIKDLILTSGTWSKPIPINSAPNNCIHEGRFSENIDRITSLTLGNITVEAIAYDALNQESFPATTIFTVDKTPLTVKSFKILDSSNNELHHFSGPMTASASAEMSDSDIASVKADFSSLKASNGIMTANCNNENCRWNNIEIDFESSQGTVIKEITINATDKLGNSRTETISYSFEYDNTVPIVTAIKTNHMDSEGNSYLGKNNNTIIVEINEAGVGFNKKNIFLDLRNINDAQNVQADSCSKEYDIWKCYWNNIRVTASEGSKQISVKPNSADDLENAIIGNLTANIIVDKTDPVVSEITYTPIAPTSADTISFNIKFTDAINEAKIKINSSSISTTPIHTGYCIGNTNCVTSVNNLVSSHTIGNVYLIIEDAAGNSVIREKTVTIYQSDINTTPNFFGIKDIELIPSRIDRKLASQIPINLFVHIILQGAGSGKIIGGTVDCTEMANFLAESPYLMNEYANDPYIVIKTNQALSILNSSLSINCKLRLQVRDNKNIYTKFEEEDVNAELELYGNILGDIENNLQKKLESVNNEIQSVEKDIQGWKKWLNIFGTYCTIAETIGKLNQAFQAMKSVVWTVVAPIYTWAFACCRGITAPVCCPIMASMWAIWTGTCTSATIFHWLADSFFWPVGTFARIFSSPWTIVGWILKISCMVFYNCALADWDGILGLAGEATKVTGLDQKIYGKISDVFGKSPEPIDLEGLEREGIAIKDSEDDWYIKADGGLKKVASFHFEEQIVNFVDGTQKSLLVRDPTLGLGSFSETESSYRDGYLDARNNKGVLNPNRLYSKGYIDGVKDYTFERLDESRFTGSETDRPPEDIYLWGQASKKTGLGMVFGSNYIFNPYKSIHYAEISMCLPAIVYNMEKDRQIKCMYRNCLTNHITSGQPITVCEFALKERECLYVESAQFLEHGYMGGLLDNLMSALLKYAIFLIFGWVIAEGPCKPYFMQGTNVGLCQPPPIAPSAPYNVACGVLGAAIAFMEFNDIFNSRFGFNGEDKMELKGPDYCGGTDDGL